MHKSVQISKADNGFVVSCYNGMGEEKEIAKTIEEAFVSAKKMLNSKMKAENYGEVKTKANKLAMKK